MFTFDRQPGKTGMENFRKRQASRWVEKRARYALDGMNFNIINIGIGR